MNWKEAILDKALPTDIESLTTTVQSVMTDMLTNGPVIIDLQYLDATKINYAHLSAVLEAVIQFAAYIPGFDSASQLVNSKAQQIIDDTK